MNPEDLAFLDAVAASEPPPLLPAPERPRLDSTMSSPKEYATAAELKGNGAGIYHLTDGVTDEQFDQAIEQARAEEASPRFGRTAVRGLSSSRCVALGGMSSWRRSSL